MIEAGAPGMLASAARHSIHVGAGGCARVLEGTRPSDLPIEQLSVFHLVLNPGAAQAQGIAMPETFEAMADEVIR